MTKGTNVLQRATHLLLSNALLVSAIAVAGLGITATSAPKAMAVKPECTPVITTAPADLTKYVGETAVFTVAATASKELSYKWYYGATLLSETSATLTLTDLELSDAGNYTVEVSAKGCQEPATATAKLTVLEPVCTAVTIKTQPMALTVSDDVNAVFKVVVEGTAPFVYQWQWSDDEGAHWANIGTNSDTLTLTEAQYDEHDGAWVRVVITNCAGKSTVTSNHVLLTIEKKDKQPVAAIHPDWAYLKDVQAGVVVHATGSGWIPNDVVHIAIRPMVGGSWIVLPETCQVTHGQDKGMFPADCSFVFPKNAAVGTYYVHFYTLAGNSGHVKQEYTVLFVVKPNPVDDDKHDGKDDDGKVIIIVQPPKPVPGSMNVGVPAYTGDEATGFPAGLAGAVLAALGLVAAGVAKRRNG